MATIFLVRHAQASFGTDDYDRLSPLGMRQATLLGKYFLDNGIQLDRIYSGDLQRQRQTAELVSEQLEQNVERSIDARFNELDIDEQIRTLVPKVVEQAPHIGELLERGPKTSRDYQKLIEAVFNYWISPDCDGDGIQSWADFSTNVRMAMRDVMTNNGSGKHIGIFSSGGTIATIVAQVVGLDPQQTYRFYEPMINCSITRLLYSSARVSLLSYNDYSYLEMPGDGAKESLVTWR